MFENKIKMLLRSPRCRADEAIHAENTHFRAVVIGGAMIQNLQTGRSPASRLLNVAHQLRKNNISTIYTTRVGADDDGDLIYNHIDRMGMDTTWIQRDGQYPTASMDSEKDSRGELVYKLPPKTAFDFIDFTPLVEQVQQKPSLVYFDSLIQRDQAARKRFHNFLDEIPETVVRVYNLNLHPECSKREIILPSLRRTDLLVLSENELAVIGDLLHSRPDTDYLANSIMDIFEISQIAITRGLEGSILYTRHGRFRQKPARFKSATNMDLGNAATTYAAEIAKSYVKKIHPAKANKHATKRAREDETAY